MNSTILWNYDDSTARLTVSRFYNAQLYSTTKLCTSAKQLAKWLKVLTEIKIDDFVQLCNLEDGLNEEGV